MSLTVLIALSRAVRTTPTWISAAFSATSATRSMPVFVSTCTLRSARVAVALARRVVRLRAVVPDLAARVCAAFFAVVERLVAAVLRRAGDLRALALRWVLVVVVSAMWVCLLPSRTARDLRRLLLSSVRAYHRTYVRKRLRLHA